MKNKQDKIMELLRRHGEPMTTKEITYALYGPDKHQSIVFGKLQEMMALGLLYKTGVCQPFYYGITQTQERTKAAATPMKKSEMPSAAPHTAVPPVDTVSSGKIEMLIRQFFAYMQASHLDIYNEFSLQHELGIFLRQELSEYKVQFERNVSFFYQRADTIKQEIDIVIYNDRLRERYAIELKHPLNGQYPEQMYAFVKDIRFMEQLRELGFTQTFAVTLVNHRAFYTGANNTGIYRYFRKDYRVGGTVRKPTGYSEGNDAITLSGEYPIRWINAGNRKYYIVAIPHHRGINELICLPDKKCFKKTAEDFTAWEERNPLEKRRAKAVDYESDLVPAEEFFAATDGILEYVSKEV